MTEAGDGPGQGAGAPVRRWAALYGMLLRDLTVLRRSFAPLMIRTVMNPLLFVFVFTYVFPRIGQGFDPPGGMTYATVVVPGLVAVGMVFTAISAVALPLAMELGGTREIEDRILAPVPVELVALEKIVVGAVQGVVAGVVVFPLVYFIPATEVTIRVASWPLLVVMVLLASLAAGALGLVLGTFVRPAQIGLMFAVVVVPITFLGCVYYPWAMLAPIPWLKLLVLVNPLVYMSEGLRAALTPDLPHMAPLASLAVLALQTVILGWLGMRGFVRRTIE